MGEFIRAKETISARPAADLTDGDVTSTEIGDKRSLDMLSISNAIRVQWDAITVTFPDTVTEVYSYRTGGTSGTIVAVATAIYTNTSKDDLLSYEVV